jgi:hypothetical protein
MDTVKDNLSELSGRTLLEFNRQRDDLVKAHKAAIAAIERQLTVTERQYDALRGVVKETASVADALRNAARAFNELQAAMVQAARAQAQAAMAQAASAQAQAAMAQAQAARAQAQAATARAVSPDGGTKGFATGGITTGPRSGHMELLHGTEAVIPLGDGNTVRAELFAPSSFQPRNDISFDEMITELQELRQEVKDFREDQQRQHHASLRAQQDTADVLEHWEVDGQPKVRDEEGD